MKEGEGLRPIDIARRIGMSTSALRHYESWGLIPPVPRSPSGYRIYTLEHLAFFECIRNMGEGFGIKLTGAVLRHVKRGNIDSALWVINDAQTLKNRDKQIALRAVSLLEEPDKPQAGGALRECMTINEVVQQTGIAASAIRYWNQIGLLQVERDGMNGYRLFSPDSLKQMILIKTLRNAGYDLSTIKELLYEVGEQNIVRAIQIARSALEEMDKALQKQLVGLHYLYKLLRELGKM
ncbi:hypothetical protein A7K91_12080 [Paenibacillus oryzae]|uniref:HTH merR-type domain-containing protein n=1 Tax=Paenibacillus oryzae TaxID=1844972 RepID=A0A1A5YF97_9BACL|nr:MerR family transcriptional regulator [Paenibacillus oryzae]OBR64263.1 hypothetical protein A7K91_12080 [Paenibacillus oryzae]